MRKQITGCCPPVEAESVHKFTVPDGMLAVVHGANFSLAEQQELKICLYRVHKDNCDGCGTNSLQYQIITKGGKIQCLCCSNTEIDGIGRGDYALFAHHSDSVDCVDVGLDICPVRISHTLYKK